MYESCLYVADSLNEQVTVLTLAGAFVRSFDVDYYVHSIAVRPDGKLLIIDGSRNRVELWTLYGSLLQVFLTFTRY